MSRILCLIDSLGAGGAERQMAYLSILLRRKGHDVKLVVFTRDNKFYDSFATEGGITPVYNEQGVNRFRRIWEIAKIVHRYKPDMTIAYKDGVCISAILAKAFGNFKLVVSERSSTPNLTRLQKFKIFLYRFADYIVPNSCTQANYIKGFSPRLASKIKVINNTIDAELFHPAHNKEINGVPVVVTTGRIKYVKNILNYLQAIALIKEAGVKCHFDWYGKTDQNDPYPNIVKEEVKRLGINDYITFHPASSEVAQVYRQSDIFCLPSFLEGFPNVICEAMSSGLPIVCSNVCDNPNIVEDGINGLLFDPKKPSDIAEKIMTILHFSHSDLEQMSKTNRRKIIDLCSENTFVSKYLSLL